MVDEGCRLEIAPTAFADDDYIGGVACQILPRRRIQKTSRRADLSTRLQPDFDHVFESRNCINSVNFFLTGNQPQHGGVSQTLFTLGELISTGGAPIFLIAEEESFCFE